MSWRHPVSFGNTYNGQDDKDQTGINMDINTEVGKLKRVGPRTAELLQSKGLNTVGDLVGYYPSRYEKYVSLSAVSASSENAECEHDQGRRQDHLSFQSRRRNRRLQTDIF